MSVPNKCQTAFPYFANSCASSTVSRSAGERSIVSGPAEQPGTRLCNGTASLSACAWLMRSKPFIRFENPSRHERCRGLTSCGANLGIIPYNGEDGITKLGLVLTKPLPVPRAALVGAGCCLSLPSPA